MQPLSVGADRACASGWCSGTMSEVRSPHRLTERVSFAAASSRAPATSAAATADLGSCTRIARDCQHVAHASDSARSAGRGTPEQPAAHDASPGVTVAGPKAACGTKSGMAADAAARLQPAGSRLGCASGNTADDGLRSADDRPSGGRRTALPAPANATAATHARDASHAATDPTHDGSAVVFAPRHRSFGSQSANIAISRHAADVAALV